MEFLEPLAFVVPGALAAALCLHAGLELRGIFADLRAKAAEQQRQVPPLAGTYFQNTIRVLIGGACLFAAFAAADVITHFISPAPVLARAFGYAGAVSLLVCSFALMLHGGVDRHLKLLSRFKRRAYPPAGAFGIGIAAAGMMLVTINGGLWA